jgi:hypothetical protein
MADKIITEYITDSTLSPVVKNLKVEIFPMFEALDRLQAMHKLLLNELDTTYLLVANLTGLQGFHKTLLGNYGVHYQKIGGLFRDHYTSCTDIINIAVAKLHAAQQLDVARLRLLDGLAIHKLKDIELTYYITHDPTCRGFATKVTSLDVQFKRAVEMRDRKFDMLHAMVFAMIRIQQEFLNSYQEAVSDLTGSSVNLDFIKTIGQRTEFLSKMLKKCIKYHAEINDGVLQDVYDAFEKYRKYNNIDIGFKMEYVSDGTFDSNFKQYTKLSTALEHTITGLKEELVETEARERLGFDARQQKVLIATNPNIVAIEGKRAAIKKSLMVRKAENVEVHTNIKQCIAKQGAELKDCIANLEGMKKNDSSKITDYMKTAETLKGMKGMLSKYYAINQILARKIVEIAQLQEQQTLHSMVDDLMKEKNEMTKKEQALAEEKAKFNDLERAIRERAMETGYDIPNTSAPGGESMGNVMRKITTSTVGLNDNVALQTPKDADLRAFQKTKNYANRSLADGLAPITMVSGVAFNQGLLPNVPNSAAKELVRRANPLIYMAGGDSNLNSATYSNPISGYSYQMNVVENGAYGHMLRREFEAYGKCVNNNKILLANALHKDMTVVRALPDSHPLKSTLYRDLLEIQSKIDDYAKIHACGLTYQKSVDGINALGFDRIVKKGSDEDPKYEVNCAQGKYGEYTPAQIDETITMMETYLECYKTMVLEFDSRCKTIEELCQKGKNTLDALVQDISRTPEDLERVKKFLKDSHKANYKQAALFGTLEEDSLKDFIYDKAKAALISTKLNQEKIINDINEQITKLEKHKLEYRYALGLVKKTNFLDPTYKEQYIRAIKALVDWVNNDTNCPCKFFETKIKSRVCEIFTNYFGYQQAIAQAIFVIYAHVERYAPHYQRSTQDRINHYAIMAREWVNCGLKCTILDKELTRVETLKTANGLQTGTKCNDINDQRTNAVTQIAAAFTTLNSKDTKAAFAQFTNATRLNVIPSKRLEDTLEALGSFQDSLNKYAQEVAKETNIFAEVAAQKSAACRTKCKLLMECIFANCQLTMIEIFNLPKNYIIKGTTEPIQLGVYPGEFEKSNADEKTNFDFIRFLTKRMLENGRNIPELGKCNTNEETTTHTSVKTDVLRGHVIYGGEY